MALQPQRTQRRDQILGLFVPRIGVFLPNGGVAANRALFSSSNPGFRSPLLHEARPEDSLGLVLVMRMAAKPYALNSRLAATRDGLDMVIFEKRRCATPDSVRTHECALAFVPLPDSATNLDRNVTLARGTGSPTRPSDPDAGFPLLQFNDQTIECPIEHFRHVSVGKGVTEEGLGITELFLGGTGNGDLKQIANIHARLRDCSGPILGRGVPRKCAFI